MKLTTHALIAGIVVFGAGVAMLSWGPERHDGIATLIAIGGAMMMGMKPAAYALNPNKPNKENGP
jgi:hypothetical protein